MNALEAWIVESGEREVWVMNELQDCGVISDLSVRAEEVAGGDCERAVKWLKRRLEVEEGEA